MGYSHIDGVFHAVHVALNLSRGPALCKFEISAADVVQEATSLHSKVAPKGE
jgi:hypothetical protein